MMNNKKLILKEPRFKLLWLSMFMLLVISVSLTSCDKNNDSLGVETYPKLKIENQLKDYWRTIYGVSLVGYKFNNLDIEPKGDSQIFTLDKGMPGGYKNIYVTVSYVRYSGVWSSASIKVNFIKGKTTTLRLTGCSGAEGCQGIYLEKIP